MRFFFVLALASTSSVASAQQFFTRDKAVTPSKDEPQAHDPMLREPDPSSIPDDPMVRTPPDEEDIDDFEEQERIHRHKRMKKSRILGFSLSIQGGAFSRARSDYEDIGNMLGPAGEPPRFGGMFVIQGGLDIKHRVRLGADFTYTHTRAFGVGADLSGLDVRQSVTYQNFLGGLLVEALFPVREILEFSLGSVLGGGALRVTENTARVDGFYDLGADLRAVPKTRSMELSAPVLWAKPALGVRARFTHHTIASFDARIGVNVMWSPRGSMRIHDDLIAYGAPHIVEIHPFITAGIAFSDWTGR